MRETPDKSGGAATTSAAPVGEIAPADDVARRPWRSLGADPREVAATLRARRLGIALMAISGAFMIALLVAAWLLARNFL